MASGGLVHDVTPENAGWTYVGFALHRLAAGESATAETGGREVCLVLISGKARLWVDGRDFGEIGERMNPFEGPPHALYVPPGAVWRAEATTDLELAVCSAPGGDGFEARAIPPGTHPRSVRGKGSNTRYVTNIMPENDGAAHALLVVEVITPGGNTSSYPPHKHDRDALPDESALEETYYHRLNPPQGFAFQRVYNRRPLAGRGRDRRRWRRRAGAPRLPPGGDDPRLRQLLSERDGRTAPDLEVPQRARARVALHRRLKTRRSQRGLRGGLTGTD